MSGKDIMIDFITYVIGMLVIAFVIFFIILGNRFEPIMNFFVSMAPVAVFILIGVVMLNIRKLEVKKVKEEEGRDEIVLYLKYSDKLTSDFVLTGVPVVSMLIAFFANGSVGRTDIIQSSVIFIILYLYFKSLYNKAA